MIEAKIKIPLFKTERDILMREVKQEKSPEYKSGYFDGVLDMYNQVEKVLGCMEKIEKRFD